MGAGGFTLSAAYAKENNFTYVDIDPQIKKIVEKDFISKVNGTFISADARSFLRENKKLYDVIVSDVYSNAITVPAELLTAEHIANIKRNLKIHGLAVFNIIANPYLEDRYSKHVDSTIRSVFKNCFTVPLNYTNEFTNVEYICKNDPNERDKTIYTDDKNSTSLEFFSASKHP